MVFFVASHSARHHRSKRQDTHTHTFVACAPAFRRLAVGVSYSCKIQAQPRCPRGLRGNRSYRTDSRTSLRICLPNRVRIQTLRPCERNGTFVLNISSSLRTCGGQKGHRNHRGRDHEALCPLHRHKRASQKVSILYASTAKAAETFSEHEADQEEPSSYSAPLDAFPNSRLSLKICFLSCPCQDPPAQEST